MEHFGLARTLPWCCLCHCRMLVVRAGHPRNDYACWHAVFFFLRRSTHFWAARVLRPPCTAVVTSVSAWPFQQVVSHRCAGVHTVQRILEARSCNASIPVVVTVCDKKDYKHNVFLFVIDWHVTQHNCGPEMINIFSIYIWHVLELLSNFF